MQKPYARMYFNITLQVILKITNSLRRKVTSKLNRKGIIAIDVTLQPSIMNKTCDILLAIKDFLNTY